MTSSIADYAFLSDCQTAALVGRDGSIDWYCPRRFDSPSVFGRLLDPDGGHWLVRPVGEYQVERRYLDRTLVLATTFVTSTGRVRLIDALVFPAGTHGHELGRTVPHELVRRVEGIEGSVEMEFEVRPRFEYGLTRPTVTDDGGECVFIGGADLLRLRAPVPCHVVDGAVSSRVRVAADERFDLRLRWQPTYGAPGAGAWSEDPIADSITAWRSWDADHAGIDGPYAATVRHSGMILQGLTFAPSGAVVAAASTSLPEGFGAGANWDYRYSWLRDSSLMLRAQWVAACPDEAERFFGFMALAGGDPQADRPQILYGVEGERDVSERELDHLRGYRGERPVRVGNDAWRQRQLDVYGEVLDAALRLQEYLSDADDHVRAYLSRLADRAATEWRDPDSGMWEARDEERRYVSSALMCWVALDRALTLDEPLGLGGDVGRWHAEREEIRRTILEEAWNEDVGAFTGAFGSDRLDASVLLMPLVGFLPATDPRMRRTIEAVERQLGDGPGRIRRWDGDPNAFVLCGFWLVECLALAGEAERARAVMDDLVGTANDVGLLAEMLDLRTGEMLGNTPQAFSHAGLIHAAWRLTGDGDDGAPKP